jgi:glycine/D-amino acid oxidase-like deaminating enzyme
MKVDYLIIGQGLAGSLLAFEFIRAGKSFFVIDNPTQAKASDVAAGVVNPVVFRRMAKSWMADDLLPHLLKTYSEMEELLGVRLFYPLQIKKVLGKDEGDFWKKKYVANQLQAYLEQEADKQQYPLVESPYGMGIVHLSGRVDIKLLVEKMKNLLVEKGLIRFEKFDFKQLLLSDERASYRDLSADKIIFCEGHAVSENPFFGGILFKHTKGEVLRLKTESYNNPFILNKGMFLMPEGNQYFRLGATYEWENLAPEITRQGREELEERLSKVFTGRYQVVDQLAGIRPTTHDRRPVVGIHPKHGQIGILNGLSSKGAMLGPWFARHLADFLCGKLPNIHPEADVNRYFNGQNNPE